MAAPIPTNEEKRLENLLDYQVLDTSAEAAFDEITKLASFICDSPISLVSLVDKDRQWFKSKQGLKASETHRDYSFCAHAILDDILFEVEDASKDVRFANNPLVTDDPNIRFYAGIPLKSKEGYNLGSLCVIDSKPKKLTDAQKSALKMLANRVMSEFELRNRLKEIKAQQEELKKVNAFKDQLLSIISHDLRSPLNSIRSTVSMFEQNMLNNEEITQLMGYLKLEATTTTKLLDNLLQWAKQSLRTLSFSVRSSMLVIL